MAKLAAVDEPEGNRAWAVAEAEEEWDRDMVEEEVGAEEVQDGGGRVVEREG